MDIGARAREAGVTIEGGIPLYTLLDRPAETVLATCIESVPLMDASRAVVLAHAARVLEGLSLVMDATRARSGVLAVPDDDLEVLRALRPASRDYRQVRIEPLQPFHPAGEPRALARDVLGVDVPADTALSSAGVLVVDVQALYDLAEACDGRPVTHRFITVAGEVGRPATLRVPIGTSFADVLALCGGVTDGVDVDFLRGGPLSGVPVDLEDTVDRRDTALAVLPSAHPAVARARLTVDTMVQRARAVCGGCRLCTDACPQHLAGHAIQPHLLMRAMAHGLSTIDDVVLGAASCVGCLTCEMVCPAGLAPGRVYSSVRGHLLSRGLESLPVGPKGGTHEAAEARRMPRARLARRLGVSRYERRFPVDDNYYVVPRVRMGADFGTPRVSVGDRVEMGSLLVSPGADGLPVHAPIPGVVSLIEGPGAAGSAQSNARRSGHGTINALEMSGAGHRVPNGRVEISSP